MAELYGLDCTFKDCVHDSLKAYRLHIRLQPDPRCHEQMFPYPISHMSPAARRSRLDVWNTKRGSFCVNERNPVVFRYTEFDRAFAQIVSLGGEAKSGAQVIEKHSSIPDGYSQRMVFLQEIQLPRIALYFRWRPDMGEILTPEKMFQCLFLPGQTWAERKNAPEQRLTDEQCEYVIRRFDNNLKTHFRQTMIKCQHCHRPLPVSVMNVLTLRLVDKGE